MRRLRRACAVITAALLAVTGLSTLAAPDPAVAAGPVRTLSVSGTGVEMYPVFDPAITRYAAVTTGTTSGALEVTATTPFPDGVVLVQGRPTSAATTTVTGLAAGDEVSVIFDEGGARTAYSVIYLPAGFPVLSVVTKEAGLAPGLVAFTLNTFAFQDPPPAFDTIVDRNGVPVYAVQGAQSNLDLKQQPNGEITVAHPTTRADRTGYSLTTLDDQLAEGTRREVDAPLTNTDGHDGVRLEDGSTLLIGYEDVDDDDLLEATIQKLDPAGGQVFTWDSRAHLAETFSTGQGVGDYAHINSVVSVENGDVIASFRNLSAVFRIATVAHDGYEEGEVIWKLGGRDSDFTFVDDPLHGFCAQHTASQLPNGNILVFDNGSYGLCPDPTDPAAPGIGHGTTPTRAVEYALDTDAGTATLVWEHAPGKNAWFAGSARRLDNGNTLIGWAADRSSLATEVADQTVLWDIRTPETTNPARRYMSYRAELITDLPDRISPTVEPGLDDGHVVVAGDVVTPRPTCTDRGGSNLQTCTVTGLSGGRLDTRTPGTRSWSVVATDGEGNTTTETRTYTVRAAGRQPDGLVRKPGGAWRGGDVYGPATRQTVGQQSRRARTKAFAWLVQNDGERADRFRVVAPSSTPRFRVRYRANGVDVTRAVVNGTYRTSTLAPQASVVLQVQVTPTRRARPGNRRTLVLRSASLSAATAVDRVGVRVRVRR